MLSAVTYAQAPASLDAAAWIEQQNARLGAGPGTVVLDRPARLDRDVTLAPSHNLQINAPLVITKASVHLAGHNSVQCHAPITANHVVAVFSADRASTLSVSNCKVNSPNATGFLLIASRSSGITMTGNAAVGMGLFNTANDGSVPTTDVTITGNSSTFPKGSGEMGIYLMYVHHALVSNNRFEGNIHGVEWWGGDANGGWHGPDSVNGATDIQVAGATCLHIGGACVWGSMGRDITVTNSSAEGCGDVCFDVEGGVNNIFMHNKAQGCNFGCYAAEFESDGTLFANNTSTVDPGHNHVLLKHNPGNGNNHTRFVARDNTFICPKGLCAALYSEGDDGLLFTHNTVLNGNVVMLNYHNNVSLEANTFRFTLDIAGNTAINGPALFNGHTSDISDNQITNEVRSSKPSTCIGQSYSDFNSTDTMNIQRNTCAGFDFGIKTVSAGPNPGAPRAVWMLSGNHINGGKPFAHEHRSGNETYTVKPDNVSAP